MFNFHPRSLSAALAAACLLAAPVTLAEGDLWGGSDESAHSSRAERVEAVRSADEHASFGESRSDRGTARVVASFGGSSDRLSDRRHRGDSRFGNSRFDDNRFRASRFGNSRFGNSRSNVIVRGNTRGVTLEPSRGAFFHGNQRVIVRPPALQSSVNLRLGNSDTRFGYDRRFNLNNRSDRFRNRSFRNRGFDNRHSSNRGSGASFEIHIGDR